MTDLGLRLHMSLADAPVEGVVEVYRAAFTAPGYDETTDDVERFRAGLPRHADRDGFRLVVASPSDAGPAGLAYGYTGRRGQWWTDRLLERVPPDVTAEWVDGHCSARGRTTGGPAALSAVGLARARPDRRRLGAHGPRAGGPARVTL